MTPRWTPSSEKHGIPREDQAYAIVHSTFQIDLPGVSRDGGVVTLFIGPPHGQTDRELELLVNRFEDGREAFVFHAMELGPRLRRYREERLRDDRR